MNLSISHPALRSTVRACILCVLCVSCSSNRSPAIPELPASEIQRFTPAVALSVGTAAKEAKANAKDPAVVGKYCMVLHAHDQFRTAVECYTGVTRLAPGRFEWWYRLALAAAESGSTNVSTTALEKALTLRPDYLPARLRRASALLEAGNLNASRTEYEAIVQDEPNSAEAHYGLGRCLAAASDVTGARSAFELACKLFPRYSSARYALAQLCLRLGDNRAAAEHLKEHQQWQGVAPALPDPVMDAVLQHSSGAQVHVARSMALEAAGHLDEAAEANLAALELNAASVQAHVNLVSLYGRLQRPLDAERHFRAAIAIDPHNADAHYNYGVLLLEQGRSREAASAFRRALDTNPRHAEAHNNYALLLEASGDDAKAFEHFRRAIEIAPSHRAARFNLARLLIRSGKPREALPHLEQIREPEQEGTTDVLYAMATAYVRSGQVENARVYVRKAYELAVKYRRNDLLDRLRHDLRVLRADSPE